MRCVRGDGDQTVDLFAFDADDFWIVYTLKEGNVEQFVDNTLDTNPLDHGTSSGVDHQQARAGVNVVTAQGILKGQSIESAVISGARQSNHGVMTRKGQPACITGAEGQRVELATLDPTELSRTRVKQPKFTVPNSR